MFPEWWPHPLTAGTCWVPTKRHVRAKSLQLCLTLCDPTNYSLPGSSVQETLQAKYWSGLPCPSPRGPSPPRDWTHVSSISSIGRWVLYHQHHMESPHSFISHHLDNHWKHLIKKKDLHGILCSRYHEIQFTREDWTQQEQSISVNVQVCVCVCVCVYTQEVGVLGSIKKDFLNLEWVWIQTKDCGFNLMGSLCW